MAIKLSDCIVSDNTKSYRFLCPGCKEIHKVYTEGVEVPIWSFNNDRHNPTFSPSILVRWVSLPKELQLDEDGKYVLDSNNRVLGAKDEICHSFITNGRIQFLSDCTHHLANQTVDLPDYFQIIESC